MAKKIGVVIGRNQHNEVAMHRAYVDCVVNAGGIPLLIPALKGVLSGSGALLDGLDGLLLAGGGDIGPLRYGSKSVATLDGLDSERDIAESAIVTEALSRGKRILAICRGAQLIAVLHGGILIQDLPSAGYFGHQVEGIADDYASAAHLLTTKAGSIAQQLLGAELTVNSHHHQGIVDAGQGIDATGWSDDGLIEVIEAQNLLGVQWHPERMDGSAVPKQSALFDWLVGHENSGNGCIASREVLLGHKQKLPTGLLN